MSFLDQIAQILGQNPAAANMLTQALQGGGQQPAAQPAFFTNGMQNALAKTPTDQIAGPIPNSPPPSAFAGDPKKFQQPLGQPAPQPASGMSDFVDNALKGFGAPPADAPEVLPEIDVQQSPVPIPPVRPSDIGGEVKTQPRHANAEANKRVGNAFDALLPVPVPPVRPADMGGDNLAAAVPASSTTTVASPAAAPASAATRSGILPDATREWLHSAFTGLATGRNWNEGLRNAGAMVAQTGSTGNVNQTRQAAIRMGLDPETAKALDGKTLANFVIQQQQAKLKGAEPTNDIREFQFAKQQGFNGSFEDWQTKKRGAGDDEFGTSLTYGTDKDGNTIAFQASKKGTLKQVQTPEGTKLSTGVDKVDLGTQYGLMDRKTGAMVGYAPKDLVGKESQEAIGKAQGTAAAAIPGAQATAEQLGQQIDGLLNDPGLSSVTGPIDARTPNFSSNATRAQSKIDQIKGGTFLQAFTTLRGAGAITEVEGQKATEAMGRLNQAQSEEDFRTALGDLKGVVQAGVDRLRRSSGGQGGGAPAPAAAPKRGVFDPATGTVKWQ